MRESKCAASAITTKPIKTNQSCRKKNGRTESPIPQSVKRPRVLRRIKLNKITRSKPSRSIKFLKLLGRSMLLDKTIVLQDVDSRLHLNIIRHLRQRRGPGHLEEATAFA